MSDVELRHLNDDHYFQWGEHEGTLRIYSEELALLRYLLAKHPQSDPLATLRAEVERLRNQAARAAEPDDDDMLDEDARSLKNTPTAASSTSSTSTPGNPPRPSTTHTRPTRGDGQGQ